VIPGIDGFPFEPGGAATSNVRSLQLPSYCDLLPGGLVLYYRTPKQARIAGNKKPALEAVGRSEKGAKGGITPVYLIQTDRYRSGLMTNL